MPYRRSQFDGWGRLSRQPDRPACRSASRLARRLARQGLTVARRTVTKYRQLMKIPAVEQRRRVG